MFLTHELLYYPHWTEKQRTACKFNTAVNFPVLPDDGVEFLSRLSFDLPLGRSLGVLWGLVTGVVCMCVCGGGGLLS